MLQYPFAIRFAEKGSRENKQKTKRSTTKPTFVLFPKYYTLGFSVREVHVITILKVVVFTGLQTP
jgi:hypothetical protein